MNIPRPNLAARAALLAGAVLLAVLAVALPASANPSAVVTTPQVRAELVAHAPQGLGPGKPMWLGLKIQHQPHWHTYWKNPGDSGLPTQLDFTLPAGVAVGEVQWPTPSRLPIGPLMNYGYEGTLLLPVALTLPPGFDADALDIRLEAEWLVCKEVCIPEGGEFALRLSGAAPVQAHADLFAAAQAALPQAVPGAQATAAVEEGALVVRVAGLPAAWQGRALAFFPETPGVIDNAAVPRAQWQGSEWSARIPLDVHRSESPTVMPVVLTRAGEIAGLALDVAVTTPWPAVTAPATDLGPGHDAVTLSSPAEDGMALGLGLALLMALAGGSLLNLMPCVFPVLSLKVLGFARPGQDRREVLAAGLAYTVGVVLSFMALAALLLALRAGGEQLGWGFQLQSPAVVAALAALFTLIGLNLAGVFEVGTVLPGSLAALRARNPTMDALLTGVLAVAVASPCTAPFMGASLGLAMTLPAWQALAVFGALGLGMALPYLALSAWPGLAQKLPRPGVWMSHFKTLMAFPMFATVIWLVWVLGQQSGIDGVAALLALLLAMAFLAWALGSPTLGRRGRGGFGTVAVALFAMALTWAVPTLRQEAVAQQGSAPAAVADGWQAWSSERVAQALAQGQPVFVDFTAAWCVTCQFNKRTTLADESVQAAFRDKGVLLLRADWTRRDAAISAELSRLGRSGVPVYALYAPGSAGPRLLSEILSPAEVRSALAALPAS